MLDLESLVRSAGYVGIGAIIFAESGLLIGFFLPGDSLLFTAGFLASQGVFDIKVLVVLCFAAAVAGDQVGYSFGYRVGRRLFDRPNSRFFKHENLVRAEEFYRRWGSKTIVFARFVPIVRTFAPIVAGIGRMPYRSFVTYNVIGGFLWAVCIPLLGFWLGHKIPDVDRYLIPIVVAIVGLSVLPGAVEFLRSRARARRDEPES